MYTLEDIQAVDMEVADAIIKEFDRQNSHIELIASENWVSPAVMSAMGSVMTNKYAEGYPGKRYYGGCDCVDIVENLAIERAKELFGPAYKGIPISVVTAVAFHNLYGKEVRYCSDRKEEKDHGADKGSFLGSKLKDGDRVVMIEDVTTSGKSMEETVPKVRGAADVTIVGLMVSLNRMEKGLGGEKSALEEIREKYGFETNAIVTMEEVVEHLYNRTCQGRVVIDDTIKAAIDDYYKQYGCN